MNQTEIEKLQAELALLPKGYISNKTINGKVRHYLQWRENGKTQSKYIPDSEWEAVAAAVARRKEIEQLLKSADIRRTIVTAPISDDYTMNVENETAIQTALSKLIENKTVIIIVHRMRTVSGADKIVVLSDGVVKESGKPDALLKQDGIFAKMVRTQKEGQAWTIA